MDIRFAPTANQRVLVPYLAQERAGVKIAARALNVDAFVVEVHRFCCQLTSKYYRSVRWLVVERGATNWDCYAQFRKAVSERLDQGAWHSGVQNYFIKKLVWINVKLNDTLMGKLAIVAHQPNLVLMLELNSFQQES